MAPTAIELPLGFFLILLPIAVVVMVIPQWPERQTVATAAAKEAATLYATAGSADEGAAAAQAAVAQAAAELRAATAWRSSCRGRGVGVAPSPPASPWRSRPCRCRSSARSATCRGQRRHRPASRTTRRYEHAPSLRRRGRGTTGSVTLLMIGVTMIVMFVGWFSFTMWNGSNERRQLAAAADQAAQAGATALDAAAFRASGVRQLDPAAAEQRAIASLADQDIEDMLTDYSINATADQIVVVLEGQVDVGLLRIFDVNRGPDRSPCHRRRHPPEEAP